MELRHRLYDVDDLWNLGLQDEHKDKEYELIDGVIIEMTNPGGLHGKLVIRLGRYLDIFVDNNRLGHVTTETGYFLAEDRQTLLAPDLAYISFERAPDPFPDKWIPAMPDLAVEIQSPRNTHQDLQEKAQTYLQGGTALVWILLLDSKRAEVWRMQEDGSFKHEVLAQADVLTGEEVLPGFQLDMSVLFA